MKAEPEVEAKWVCTLMWESLFLHLLGKCTFARWGNKPLEQDNKDDLYIDLSQILRDEILYTTGL